MRIRASASTAIRLVIFRKIVRIPLRRQVVEYVSSATVQAILRPHAQIRDRLQASGNAARAVVMVAEVTSLKAGSLASRNCRASSAGMWVI